MLKVEIITPEETVYEGEADAVTLPTSEGEITVLPHHVALMTTLAPGVAILRRGAEEQYFAMSAGVIEIDGTTVRILAEIADRAETLQEDAIEKAKQAAEKVLSERRSDATGFADALAVLDREIARLKTVRRHRGRKNR